MSEQELVYQRPAGGTEHQQDFYYHGSCLEHVIAHHQETHMLSAAKMEGVRAAYTIVALPDVPNYARCFLCKRLISVEIVETQCRELGYEPLRLGTFLRVEHYRIYQLSTYTDLLPEAAQKKGLSLYQSTFLQWYFLVQDDEVILLTKSLTMCKHATKGA